MNRNDISTELKKFVMLGCVLGLLIVGIWSYSNWRFLLGTLLNDKGVINYRVVLASQDTYSSPKQIIDKIPENIFPTYGPDGALERGACAKFLEDTIIGNEIEFL